MNGSQDLRKSPRHRAHNLLMIVDFACAMLEDQIEAEGRKELDRIRFASQGLKEIIDKEIDWSTDESV